VADRHVQRANHAAAVHGDLLAAVDSGVNDHLDAVHIGREQADENPAWRLVHDVFKALLDGRFRRGPAQAFGRGALAEQRQNAFFAKLGQALDIAALMVQRVRVKPEVTGVNDPANGRVEHDAGTAGNGVRDAYQLDEEFADFQAFMGILVHHDRLQLEAVGHRQTEVLEDFLDTADSELTTINRRRELRYDVRQAADVVQVPVGDDVSAQLGLDLLQVRRVGDTVVNAGQIDAKVVAAVQNDGVIHILDKNHVLRTAAIHTAEADNLQARGVINDVGARRLGVIGRNVLVGDALGILLAAALGADSLATRGGQAGRDWRPLGLLVRWASVAAAFLAILAALPRIISGRTAWFVVICWLHRFPFSCNSLSLPASSSQKRGSSQIRILFYWIPSQAGNDGIWWVLTLRQTPYLLAWNLLNDGWNQREIVDQRLPHSAVVERRGRMEQR